MICEARTDVGTIRTVNEDSILVDNERGIYLLADGMGGHKAGEVASRLAVDIAYSHIRDRLDNSESKEIEKIMVEAFQVAHQGVKASARENQKCNGMGTTLLATVIVDNKAYVCSVGDSRLYLIRSSISQITVDDTLANFLLVNKKMSQAKIPERYWNMLTQAIGGESQLSPTTKTSRFFPDDMLIMCSDGLYRMVSDKEIQESCCGKNIGLNIIADELLTKALDNGGRDNVSLILITQ
jgi:protein phosphatase